jgi:hypothetical protein
LLGGHWVYSIRIFGAGPLWSNSVLYAVIQQL